MAAQDAADGKIESTERTMFTDSLNGILRAGRREAARRRCQRRYAPLIEVDGQQEELRQQASHDNFSAMRESSVLTLEFISAVGTISSEI
jgi:hypothetical protein